MGPQFFVDGGFVCTYKGITRLLGRGSVRITPAHAGKSPQISMRILPQRDHPRTRGEKTSSLSSCHFSVGSPPHTRGKDHRSTSSLSLEGITPAHAGKSTKIAVNFRRKRDHPRTRGEKAMLSP